MLLAGLAVNRGFTIMFSDFSLKALIAEWSEEHLGPNPFSRLRQGCTGQMVLEFLPAELQVKEVPQQLQVVGELCAEQGKAAVKVLTVVSEVSGGLAMPDAMKCSVGDGPDEKRGAAGHVTLTYASGGQLVASAGHWIELSRLDTTEEQVAQVAARNFGAEMRTQYESELAQFSSAQERYDCSQRHPWGRELSACLDPSWATSGGRRVCFPPHAGQSSSRCPPLALIAGSADSASPPTARVCSPTFLAGTGEHTSAAPGPGLDRRRRDILSTRPGPPDPSSTSRQQLLQPPRPRSGPGPTPAAHSSGMRPSRPSRPVRAAGCSWI
ncbi:unnamed protein product [Prorocentrum cordatum]|uniref:Uncharacterized protein n=1 Tax=Prorocentrum cordatum TaxID=2364126 RepID=A0ABN9RNM0_9DINO|nr:unnamed protein product [Polarella glacialis]